MTESQLIVLFFGVPMCAMALAASYFEAKEKSRSDKKTLGFKPDSHSVQRYFSKFKSGLTF